MVVVAAESGEWRAGVTAVARGRRARAVTAIAPVDVGPLAFSSNGDLYCARSSGEIVRLTDTPEEEQLFP